MAEPRAQRTLVKSPPELWAEVSDAASLAKRLGEFGEIRITRLEPETTVVWEGERASGTVKLEPSGWGTKVTLTAMPVEAPPAPEGPSAGPATDAPEDGPGEQDAPEPAAVAVAEQPPAVEPEPVAELEPVVVAEPAAVTEPEPVVLAEPVAVPEPEPKRGFFARLFGRRTQGKRAMVAVEPPAAEEQSVIAEPPATVEPPAAIEPAAETPTPTPPPPAPPPPEPPVEPIPDPIPEPPPALPSEPDPVPPPTIEALDEDHVVGVLTSALDDLGAAHHRPFSR